MIQAAFFSGLITPPFVIGQMIVGFQWPAALAFAAIIALAMGLIFALNDGIRSARWVLLPMALAHLEVFAWTLLGALALWIGLVIEFAAIVWLVWKCRESIVSALLLAFFCLVYCGAAAVPAFGRIGA
jgi:hypothetical protein